MESSKARLFDDVQSAEDLNLGDTGLPRPENLRHLSLPSYTSPLRHRQRAPSQSRTVKETLHARSQYTNDREDGAVHRINQYIIKEEIGRGSFGAVHRAVDQFGKEYAVKEFSKHRLRRRAQSNLLRKPPSQRNTSEEKAWATHLIKRHSTTEMLDHGHAEDDGDDSNALSLIRAEIAIMKKLHHDNLVSLYEVLDDPEEDSLYMVLEMCEKGVIMKVGIHEQADPYEMESCRCWFRDLILGIEYLHHQGIVHRDIKPDNLLLTKDDILKIVDFGVSEMFAKDTEMTTVKSAGSPAFLPPELCVAKHGPISGKAADIWSMGVTLHCLRYGRVPFEQVSAWDLYQSIREDDPHIQDEDKDFEDLLKRLLEKDPAKRIQMAELRDHPWVTSNGSDPLMPADENTANDLIMPTDEEVNGAITGKLRSMFTVMRAITKFKALISRGRPQLMEETLHPAHLTQSPGPMSRKGTHTEAVDSLAVPRSSEARSVEADNRRNLEQALTREGVHRQITLDTHVNSIPTLTTQQPTPISPSHKSSEFMLSESPVTEDLPQRSWRRQTTRQADLRRHIHANPALHRGRSDEHDKMHSEPLPTHKSPATSMHLHSDAPGLKGHATNPSEEWFYVGVGAGTDGPDRREEESDSHTAGRKSTLQSHSQPDSATETGPDEPGDEGLSIVVSESPPAVESSTDIYALAYRDAIQKIKDEHGEDVELYLTRRVEKDKDKEEKPRRSLKDLIGKVAHADADADEE